MTIPPVGGPDFLIIGAQKAGTTSLFEYLIRHPDVAAPVKKELHFFDVPDRFRRGVAWYRELFPSLNPSLSGHTSRRQVTGEASPYYLFHPRVPASVVGLFPQVKLIALLRNPADRAYSQYQMWVRAGREPLSFDEAIAAEAERLEGAEARLLADSNHTDEVHRRHSYLARGVYVDQLARWTQHFGREQMLILKTEDLFADTQRIIAEVFEFLGLPQAQLDLSERYNVRAYDPLPSTSRDRLIEYFEPHNRRLYEFLGRDFEWY